MPFNPREDTRMRSVAPRAVLPSPPAALAAAAAAGRRSRRPGLRDGRRFAGDETALTAMITKARKARGRGAQ